MNLEEIARMAGASLLCGDASARVRGVSTDSRTLAAGDLFVALRGDRFDGHGYLPQAAGRGAAGALVAAGAGPADTAGRLPLIESDDTLAALQRLAAAYRRTLALKVVGITGSNGKTSTKDMTAAVLGRRFHVVATQGNLNNHIGLPLSLLEADRSHEFGVFEMGMNHPGEIGQLAEIAAPDIAIVTNVGVAHIGFMGTKERIATEKGALARAVPASGTVILPAGDEFIGTLRRGVSAQIVMTGVGAGDVRAESIRMEAGGVRFVVRAGSDEAGGWLPVPGEHMVRNALMAVAAGLVAGIPLADCVAGLRGVALTGGRLARREVAGIAFLDDSYNANTDSVLAALRTLAAMPVAGRRIAVLGPMGELGDHEQEGYRAIGREAAAIGIDLVLGVGAAAEIARSAEAAGMDAARPVDDAGAAARILVSEAKPGDQILVKGSRAARMERIIGEFENLFRPH